MMDLGRLGLTLPGHGFDDQVNFSGRPAYAFDRIGESGCITGLDQPFFSFSGKQSAHGFAVIQKDVDLETLILAADIFYGHIEMQGVAAFPFLDHTGKFF